MPCLDATIVCSLLWTGKDLVCCVEDSIDGVRFSTIAWPILLQCKPAIVETPTHMHTYEFDSPLSHANRLLPCFFAAWPIITVCAAVNKASFSVKINQMDSWWPGLFPSCTLQTPVSSEPVKQNLTVCSLIVGLSTLQMARISL